MKSILPFIITIFVLAVTLATFVLPIPFLVDQVRPRLVSVALFVAAVAVFLGVLNLVAVHLTRLFRMRSDSIYSFVLLATLVIVLLVGLVQGFIAPGSGQDQIQARIAGGAMVWVYKYILLPIQASLTALLPFLLAFAAYRTLRVRRNLRSMLGAFLFMGTAILVLLGQVPLFGLKILGDIRTWIVLVPATAGMRGIVLGVALGITATALRVLIGVERPASD